MIMQWTVERLRRSGSIPVLAAALLLAAGSVQAAPPDDSNAGERAETPRAEPQESPSEPPPQAPAEPPSESPSEPPSPPSPSTQPSDNGSGADSPASSGHTAVPTGTDDRGHGPNRQPPTQHGGRHGDDGGGARGDGSYGGSWSADDDSPGGGSGYGPFPYHGGGARDGMGALDLDISPSRTQVFLEGQSIGTVDDFDGWPRYLWLPEGTYDLVFYLDGYLTLGRQMTVRRGLVIDMDDHLQPGRSIRPEDFQPEPRE